MPSKVFMQLQPDVSHRPLVADDGDGTRVEGAVEALLEVGGGFGELGHRSGYTCIGY